MLTLTSLTTFAAVIAVQAIHAGGSVERMSCRLAWR